MCCLISRSIFAVVVTLLSLLSCERRTARADLFPIDRVLDAQIQFLSASDAQLHKEALIGQTRDESTYVPAGTAMWETEFEILRRLNEINKPVNSSNYVVEDGLPDPASNLTVKSFTARTSMPVRYFKVFYQESISKPRKIEALYDEKNLLLKSGRKIAMEFEQIGSEHVLTSYAVDGGQRVILGDTVAFAIRAKIFIR